MAVGPEKKETVKGDWCNPTKDLPIAKSVFSQNHKEGKNSECGTYPG